MDKRGMKPILRCLVALVFLVPAGGAMRPALAENEDCRLPTGLQCLWDQEDFQGQMRAADLSGQCTNYPIRSAANNGKSGYFTLYLYEEPNCAGDAIGKLNASESARSVTAKSARFAPKDS